MWHQCRGRCALIVRAVACALVLAAEVTATDANATSKEAPVALALDATQRLLYTSNAWDNKDEVSGADEGGADTGRGASAAVADQGAEQGIPNISPERGGADAGRGTSVAVAEQGADQGIPDISPDRGQPSAVPMAADSSDESPAFSEVTQLSQRLQDTMSRMVSGMQSELGSQEAANKALADQNANISSDITHLKHDIASLKKKTKKVAAAKKEVLDALRGVQDLSSALVAKPGRESRPSAAAYAQEADDDGRGYEEDLEDARQDSGPSGASVLQVSAVADGGSAGQGPADGGLFGPEEDDDSQENEEDTDDFGLSFLAVASRQGVAAKSAQDLLSDLTKGVADAMQEEQAAAKVAATVSTANSAKAPAQPVVRRPRVLLQTAAASRPRERRVKVRRRSASALPKSGEVIDERVEKERERDFGKLSGKLMDVYQSSMDDVQRHHAALLSEQRGLLDTRRSLQREKARLERSLHELEDSQRQLSQKAAKLGGYLANVAATSGASAKAAMEAQLQLRHEQPKLRHG